jgi:hypothetical protein
MIGKHIILEWQDELIRIDYHRKQNYYIVTAKDTGEELPVKEAQKARNVSCVYHDMTAKGRPQTLEWCEGYAH